MAPPKRKTTGRVTPKGTRPGDAPRTASSSAASSSAVGGSAPAASSSGVAASSRYTPPVPKELRESPRWLPILMFTLLALGGLVILLRYLVWPDSNLPVLIGLGFLLAGLYTATKWH